MIMLLVLSEMKFLLSVVFGDWNHREVILEAETFILRLKYLEVELFTSM